MSNECGNMPPTPTCLIYEGIPNVSLGHLARGREKDELLCFASLKG